MTHGRLVRVRRIVARTILVSLVLVVVAGAAACPFAGRYLIVHEPLTRADAIIVLAGAQVDRWLEGADLYREGYAPLILLSPGYEDPLGDAIRARGINFPRLIDIQRDAMVHLGTPREAIEIMPRGYDNTADEAVGTRRIAQARGWTHLIVVTSPYHTRRTGYAFRREMKGTGIRITVKGSRHDRPTPDGWWKHRGDLRWVTSEVQKLIAYRLGLGR